MGTGMARDGTSRAFLIWAGIGNNNPRELQFWATLPLAGLSPQSAATQSRAPHLGEAGRPVWALVIILAGIVISVGWSVQAAWVVLIRPKSWERHGLKPWIEAAKKRLHPNVLAIALANKLARIAWAVLKKERNFECIRTNTMASRSA
jgi:hypothetical protein